MESSTKKEESQNSQVKESNFRSRGIRNKKDLNKVLEGNAQINEHKREEKNKDLKSDVVRLGIKFTSRFFAVALGIWLFLGLFPSCPSAIELSKRLWLVISNIFELFIGALIGKFIGL